MGPGRHCRGCGRLANPIFISSYIISDVFSLGNIEIVVLMPKRYTFGALAARTRRVHGAQQARKRCEIGTLMARLRSPPKLLEIGEYCHAEYRRFCCFVCDISAPHYEYPSSSGELNTPQLLGWFNSQLSHTLAANLQSSGNTSSSAGGNIHICSRPISAHGPYHEAASSRLLSPNRLIVYTSVPLLTYETSSNANFLLWGPASPAGLVNNRRPK